MIDNLRAVTKKASIILVLLFLLSLFSACFYSPQYENSVYNNGRDDLLVLFTYSVPFLYDLDIRLLGDVEIYPVEEDEFGRTLGVLQFNRKKRNILFDENAVYCVLQTGSNTESCFYEDICCIMVEKGNDPTEAIEQLKRDNDWNFALSLDKCRIIPINHHSTAGVYDNQYGYTDYETMACKKIGWAVESAWIDVLCKDGCGLWLFSLVKDKQEEDSPVCLIMMKEDSSDDPKLSIVGTRFLDSRSSPWEKIHAFKKDMGWFFVSNGNKTDQSN